MGVVTELFIAGEVDVTKAFHGWSLPSDTPSLETSVDPFTGASFTLKTWKARDEVAEDAAPAAPDVTSFPRVHLRTVTPLELLTLQRAVLARVSDGDEDEIRRPVRVAPKGRGQWLHRVPADLVARLASLGEDEVLSLGARWADFERARLESIHDDAVRLSRIRHHRVRLWQDTLDAVVGLARVTVDRHAGLYLYMHI